MAEAVSLTPAQQRVLQMVEDGKKPKEIAKKLRITTNGVYSHIRKLKAKGALNGNGAPVPAPAEPQAVSPEAVSVNGSSGSETIEWARDQIGKSIEGVSVRIEAIDQRASDIDREQKALEEERQMLATERADLSKMRESLYEASGEQIPF